jgi:TolB-like protein
MPARFTGTTPCVASSNAFRRFAIISARSMNLEFGFRLAQWDVHPRRGLLVSGTRARRVEPRAMDVLTCLAREGNAPVTRSEFLKEVWQGRVVTDEVLSRCISQLRARLDDDPRAPRFIETLPKIGYRLLIAAIPLEASAPQPPSIAVLPFVNMSPDRENGHFADGVSEELLNAIAMIPGIRVAARTSSSLFKGSGETPWMDGRTLAMNYFVEGSVRRSGEHVRVAAQLILVGTGCRLCSWTFDRVLGNTLALQEEIARLVADGVRRQLFSHDDARGSHRAPHQLQSCGETPVTSESHAT